MLEFVEDGLVYRLVWALESVRVHAGASTGFESPSPGRAALAVETGTPDLQSALLIQTGLASRIAAVQAIGDCPADFTDVAGMRRWFSSECVVRREGRRDWPTADTRQLWKEFITSFERTRFQRWRVRQFTALVTWIDTAAPYNSMLRIRHDDESGATLVFTADWQRVAVLKEPLPRDPIGNFIISSAHEDSISGVYLGPRDIEVRRR